MLFIYVIIIAVLHKQQNFRLMKWFSIVFSSADSPSTKDIEDFISKKSSHNAKLLQIDLKDKITLANNMREACLPKLLCEIAAKPANVVTEKEQSLLDLIR